MPNTLSSHTLPQRGNDIFVSYAQVDNQPLPGADKGWVTTLIEALRILLGQKLGRADAYSLWMDKELRGNQRITSEISQKVENSTVFLLILSPGYLASEWCRLELSIFLAKTQKSGYVFVVERDDVERPAQLDDLLGYKFWQTDDAGKPRTLAVPEPNKAEREYYDRLDDLARDISEKINYLKKAITNGTYAHTHAQASPTTPTIFLATVSEDLEARRDEVQRYLESQGVCILPERNYTLTNIQTLDQDLKKCRMFVQLLSEKASFGLPLQYERAKTMNLPILQWRDKALELNRVHDADHKKLLLQNTVIAESLVVFQERIINQLNLKPVATKPISNNHLVFLNAAPDDLALAKQISHILTQQGIGCILPLSISDTTSSPDDIRKDLEQNLLDCNAVIVFYDNTPVTQVREQLRYCQRMQAQREQPFKIIAVYVHPSITNKPPVGIKIPNMIDLECPTPQADSCLSLFQRNLS